MISVFKVSKHDSVFVHHQPIMQKNETNIMTKWYVLKTAARL